MNGIGHELSHPFIPDALHSAGNPILGSDEGSAQTGTGTRGAGARVEWLEGTLVPSADAPSTIAVVGSAGADSITGGAGDDALSGQAGNDMLAVGAGINLLYGGYGQDWLIADGVNDLLVGGMDADTYVIGAGAFNPFIAEDGGVDLLQLNDSFSDYSITRSGDNLILFGGGGEITIYNQMGADGTFKVELFAFTDATYSSSYIEYIAAGGQRPDECYDASGQRIVCGTYATPVVIDLGGDGVRFIDASVSGVRMDVDGDGVAERLSWIDASDAILVLDRNGDGLATDFSELTFIGDQRGAGTDIEGLLAFDSDQDGFLTAADARFGDFRLWIDADGDGRSTASEMHGLAEFGITSIGLEIFGRRSIDHDLSSSQQLGWSTIASADGQAVAIDVAFRFIRDTVPECGCGARSMYVGPQSGEFESQQSPAGV